MDPKISDKKNKSNRDDYGFKAIIIRIAILVLIPLFIGSVLYLITKREEFFEVPLVIFGLIELLIVVRKFSKNDRKNVTDRGTYKNNKDSLEYLEYKFIQTVLLISAFTNIFISYAIFMLLGD